MTAWGAAYGSIGRSVLTMTLLQVATFEKVCQARDIWGESIAYSTFSYFSPANSYLWEHSPSSRFLFCSSTSVYLQLQSFP